MDVKEEWVYVSERLGGCVFKLQCISIDDDNLNWDDDVLLASAPFESYTAWCDNEKDGICVRMQVCREH